jgi:hypothetical protein
MRGFDNATPDARIRKFRMSVRQVRRRGSAEFKNHSSCSIIDAAISLQRDPRTYPVRDIKAEIITADWR